MDGMVSAYLTDTFRNIRQIKANRKGKVWLASEESGRLVIVKRIFLTGLPYPELKQLAPMLCPRIYHCFEDAGETIIVEEYVQGESLADRLKEKRYLSEAEARSILLQLCEGLAPIHQRNIIHRDIKPSNLILQHGGIVRLIDFDAARTVKEQNSEDTKRLGTKGYAPPEQFGYGQTDARSDIYAIGVTIKKLLGKGYHGSLVGVLAKCMELDPKKRYSSVTTLKRAVLLRSKWEMLKLPACALLAVFVIAVGWPILKDQSSPKDTAKEEISVEHPATMEQALSSSQEGAIPSQIMQDVPDKAKDSEAVQDLSDKSNTASTDVLAEIPARPPLEPSMDMPSGNIEASLYLGGAMQSPSSTSSIHIAQDEWQQWQGAGNSDGRVRLSPGWDTRLHIINRSNRTWEHPAIRILLSENWNGILSEDEMELPPLSPHESADFAISLERYEITGRANTSVWVQIYLNEGNVPLSEKYWCVKLELDGE